MAHADPTGWYQLFSRGARDWLRHNDKLRQALREQLPDECAGPDAITSDLRRMLRVPAPQLTLARLRLAETAGQLAVGHGPGQAGALLRPAGADDGRSADGGGRDGAGRVRLDIALDDLIDCLWEQYQLPDLRAPGTALRTDAELVRDGWDQRGTRSRLDRRRTLRQALKRRAVQPGGAPFATGDLRYRQLVRRPRATGAAAVFFVLDASASMTEAERRLAKTFFFVASRGLRRHYHRLEFRFIAHTSHAWEFAEHDFFQVSGDGGTVASTAFELALALMDAHGAGHRDNSYLFYASDGDNFPEDRTRAEQALGALCDRLNYLGYVETVPGMPRAAATEMTRLCAQLAGQGRAVGCGRLATGDDVWHALRTFFVAPPAAGAAM